MDIPPVNAMEPISVFGRELDRAAVARRMRELAGGVVTDSGRDDGWTRLTATFGGGLLRRRKTLALTYSPEHCSEPNWSRQMSGFREYWSRLPDTPRKPRVMMLSTTLEFVLGTLPDPELDGPGDPRTQAIFEIAELLDAVLFLPSALLDARGRVLVSVDGTHDPDAVWPRVAYEVDLAGAAAAYDEAEGDDDLFEPDPPAAGRVAMRVLALAALTARGLLEVDRDDPDPAGTLERVRRWARDTGAADEMEPAEREALHTPLGSLPHQAKVNAIWRLEGLAVLLWALGRATLPPHDQIADAQTLWAAAGLLDADVPRELRAAPALRPRDELEAMRERMFALHWRVTEYRLRPKPLDFPDLAARMPWLSADAVATLPMVEGDLAVGGARIDRATEDAFVTARSIAMERHLAINWLRDGPALYSATDVST